MKGNPTRRLAIVFTAGMAALACSPAGAGDADTSSDAPADGAADCTAESAAAADLEGWWAVRVYVMLEMVEDPSATIHVCNDPPVSLATVTWLVRAGAPSGSDVGYTFRTCELTLPQVNASFADCSLGETLTAYLLTSGTLDASLPAIEEAGTLHLSGLGECASLETDDLFVHIGVGQDFSDSVPLPGWDPDCSGTTAEECVPGLAESVLDTDDDGFPGGTFEITTDPVGLVGGFARATLRHSPNLLGTLRSSILADGGMLPTLEYDLVGSDASMAGLDIDTPTVKENLPTFVPVADQSQFVMVRVDGTHGAADLTGGDGVVDCAELLASAWVFE